jgi:hypothetical protein
MRANIKSNRIVFTSIRAFPLSKLSINTVTYIPPIAADAGIVVPIMAMRRVESVRESAANDTEASKKPSPKFDNPIENQSLVKLRFMK